MANRGWLRGGQWLLAALVLTAAALLLQASRTGTLVETGMQSLVPASHAVDEAELRAEAQGERLLNQQMVLLVGAPDARQAAAAAEELAQRWRASGLFAEVREKLLPDLSVLQQQLAPLQLALMPTDVLDQLRTDPAAYFLQRAQDLGNPFGRPSLFPVADDWLGLGRFLLGRMPGDNRLRWDASAGTLQSEDAGLTWVWVLAKLNGDGGIAGAPVNLLPLLDETRAAADGLGVKVLTAGGAIFAAEGRAQGELESRWMSGVGIALTLTLLLLIVRSLRVFFILLPLGVGFLLGLAGCVLVFGQVHVLTLVVGSSLVGVMVDLPMHWLAPALLQTGWRPWPTMRRVLPSFGVSIAITVAGYLALGVAPLPVLQETALFSTLALCGASAASALWLPASFEGWKPIPRPGVARAMAVLQRAMLGLRSKPWFWGAALLVVVSGCWRADWRDDIRQWVSTSPTTLEQMQAVGRLGGSMASGRYLLVQAPDDDTLLMRDAELARHLSALQSKGDIQGFLALSQWVQPVGRQHEIRTLLNDLAANASAWQPMRALGVPDARMRQAIDSLVALPPVGLEQSLQNDLAIPWQPLYLGAGADGQVAALLQIRGVQDMDALQSVLKELPWARLIDRPARLNALFQDTRGSVIWLKLLSWLGAALLLSVLFGWRRAVLVLAVPTAAVLATVATLGWVGLPVSLFAVFGLLLASAIGIDYAVYAQGARPGEGPERFAGILLAALTSMISFALLGLSHTPAVSGFGICVTVGIAFNLVFSTWLPGTANDASGLPKV